jgi:hypothetical protein
MDDPIQHTKSTVVTLAPGRPIADVAAELKAELHAKLLEVCPILDKIYAADLDAVFMFGRMQPRGQSVLASFEIKKVF